MIYTVYDLPDIDFVGGSTEDLIFHVFSNASNPQPYSLIGCTANFAIIDFANRHGSPIISKRMEARMSVADKLEDQNYNILFVGLEPKDTLDLFGKYIYQITIMDAEGNVDIPKQGIIYINKNIDKSFVSKSL